MKLCAVQDRAPFSANLAARCEPAANEDIKKSNGACEKKNAQTYYIHVTSRRYTRKIICRSNSGVQRLSAHWVLHAREQSRGQAEMVQRVLPSPTLSVLGPRNLVLQSRYLHLRVPAPWTCNRFWVFQSKSPPTYTLYNVYDGATKGFKQMMHVHAIHSPTLSSEPITIGSGSIATDVPIMVNDCSGKMGRAVAEAAVEAGLQLVPFCLTGPGFGQSVINIKGVEMHVHEASEKEDIFNKVLEKYPGVIVADYTLPAAVNENAEFYIRRGVPFVMGTTGGDREKLLKSVSNSGVYAVIAPQMGKQVVAFQAAMEIMAEQFPGAFAGYKLEVTESHQSSKVDTSGTARAVVASFNKLGLCFADKEIKMVRNPEEQVTKMGVPEEHLKGHAFHTYSLLSPDGMVRFQFQHNVCGRSIYAQGTVDAVLFLAKKVQERADQKIYNMVDVLRGGNMR